MFNSQPWSWEALGSETPGSAGPTAFCCLALVGLGLGEVRAPGSLGSLGEVHKGSEWAPLPPGGGIWVAEWMASQKPTGVWVRLMSELGALREALFEQ